MWGASIGMRHENREKPTTETFIDPSDLSIEIDRSISYETSAEGLRAKF